MRVPRYLPIYSDEVYADGPQIYDRENDGEHDEESYSDRDHRLSLFEFTAMYVCVYDVLTFFPHTSPPCSPAMASILLYDTV